MTPLLVLLAAFLALPRPAQAQGGLEFFKEAQVTSASRRASDISRAPATVYVVSARQIRESGAQTIPDALRGVPGVDVIGERAMMEDVSIRGLDGPLANRTLVLIDGRTVQNGFYDFPVWESLPITMDEIDRIEVVEGPVSALYGPNAFNGAINIITRKPADIGTARASLTAGEDALLFGSAMHGRAIGPWSYKLDLGWRSADKFVGPGQASQARLGSALVSRDLGAAGVVSVSGGLNTHRAQISAAASGPTVDHGTTGFLRGDWTRGLTKARVYWNSGRTTFREMTPETPLAYDTIDAQVEQGFSPAEGHDATVGAEYRRNQARSPLFGPPSCVSQDLWAGFAEDNWRVADAWTLEGDARLDHHPLAGFHFSPRGAVVWQPRSQDTVRLSAGTAFRNPTLVEDYIDLVQASPSSVFTILGNGALGPERTTQAELAYMGQYPWLRARASVFMYRARDLIVFSQPQLVSFGPPPSLVTRTQNVGGTRAWGAETLLETPLALGFSAQAGWSLEYLKDDDVTQVTANSAPRHKVSGSLAWRREGWTLSSSAFWQSATSARSNNVTDPFVATERIPDYWLLSARVAYAFKGGFEAALSAWNLADRRHNELTTFQGGETLGRRIAGTLSWRLP